MIDHNVDETLESDVPVNQTTPFLDSKWINILEAFGMLAPSPTFQLWPSVLISCRYANLPIRKDPFRVFL